MSSRRKNKHPKRAENAKTVVVASAAEEERVKEGEGGERGPVLLCLRIPDDEQRNGIRKEKTTATKRGKRKRGQHECGVCEKVFGSQADLAVHMRTHTNEKPYECDVCEKRFTQSSSLKVHMRIHTNEMFECDVCEKRFTQASNLKVHMRIHTNEKPYKCDVCEKRFTQSGSLKKHTRTQH